MPQQQSTAPLTATATMDITRLRMSDRSPIRSTKLRLKAMLVNDARIAPTPAVAGGMPPCSAKVAAAATALALENTPPMMLTA